MANDDISTARRNLVRGAALGLAASAASVAAPSLMAATNDAPQAGAGVSANGSSSGVGSSPRDVALVDPRGEYPHPPFAAQTQAWPGLASRMNPRPDHGETSYVGSGKLAGRKALITGGDSGLGRRPRLRMPEKAPMSRSIICLRKKRTRGKLWRSSGPLAAKPCRSPAICDRKRSANNWSSVQPLSGGGAGYFGQLRRASA